MKIVVNGKAKVVKPRISYSEVIMLVYQNGSRPDHPTITYHAKLDKDHFRQGILHDGDTIDVCDGMVFNVADTNNA